MRHRAHVRPTPAGGLHEPRPAVFDPVAQLLGPVVERHLGRRVARTAAAGQRNRHLSGAGTTELQRGAVRRGERHVDRAVGFDRRGGIGFRVPLQKVARHDRGVIRGVEHRHRDYRLTAIGLACRRHDRVGRQRDHRLAVDPEIHPLGRAERFRRLDRHHVQMHDPARRVVQQGDHFGLRGETVRGDVDSQPSGTGGHFNGIPPARVGSRLADEVRFPVAVLTDRHRRPADRRMRGAAPNRPGHGHGHAAVRLHLDGDLPAGGRAPVVRGRQPEGENGRGLHQRRDEPRGLARHVPNGHRFPRYLSPAVVHDRPVRVRRLARQRHPFPCIHRLGRPN